MPPVRLLVCLLLAAAAASTQHAVLQGQVVDVLGDSVPAARLRLLDATGAPLREGKADGDGMFVLPLPATAREVEITAAGRLALRVPVPDGPERRAMRCVLEEAVPRRGTVRNAAGAPLPGAQIVAFRRANSCGAAWSADAVTGANGEFAFASAPVGELRLRAWTPGCEVAEARSPRADDATALVLQPLAAPPREIHVEGVPPGRTATLVLESEREGPLVLPAALRALTADERGRVVVPHLQIVDRMSVACPGCRSTPESAVAWRSAVVRFRVEALPARLVDPHTTGAFRVLGPDGAPLAGVALLCSHGPQGPFVRATTGADGVARPTLPVTAHVPCLVKLADCPWQVDATWPDSLSLDPDEVHDVRAHAVGGIRVQAKLPDGTPMRFAPVMVWHDGYPLQSATDRDGRCELLGVAGKCSVLVRGATFFASAQTNVAPGRIEDLSRWEFEMLGECSGVVRDAAGRPLAGVEVAAGIVADQEQRRRLGQSACTGAGTTDGRGRYRLRGLVPGRWSVGGTEVEVRAGATAAADVVRR
jgi:hypothetical protein